jgi:hypothetical protein
LDSQDPESAIKALEANLDSLIVEIRDDPEVQSHAHRPTEKAVLYRQSTHGKSTFLESLLYDSPVWQKLGSQKLRNRIDICKAVRVGPNSYFGFELFVAWPSIFPLLFLRKQYATL